MNSFEHTRRPRFFQKPKQTEEFNITWNGKEVKARGSTTILKNTVLIEINLLQFIAWFNVLKGQRKQSMGTENCDSILKCMLKTLQHELVHAICILCSPTIYVNGTAIGSFCTLNVKGDTSNAATGHSTWYMDLLGNIFGQKNDFHDNYTYRQKAKLRL